MHFFLKILKYIKPYSVYVCFNILSNILSVLFSLFSITMVIPFLGILFGTQEKVSQAQALAFNASSIKDNFYFIISKTINSKGETEALMFICILVLAMFFFKNLFIELSLFIPITEL